MLLKKLINNIPKSKENIKITGLSTISNEVKKNYIFFAINGNKTNGENFIDEAISNGEHQLLFVPQNVNIKTKIYLQFERKI